MADLDVAVTLKFLTTGADKLKTAARDLQAFGKIGNKATGRFGGDMTKAWTASVKLGGALNKSAGAANKTAAAIRSIGGSAAGIDKTRAAVDRLTKSTNAAASSSKKMRGGALGAAMLGGGAMGRRAGLRDGLAEAASRITPEGYLLGASGAVMAGAALGGTVAGGLAGVAVATKEAIDRNKSFASIMKKVTLEGGDSFDTLDRKIRNVSTSIGMSYSDAAAIFAQGGQGNVAYKDLENFAMLGAKVSTAWDISARDAAQMLTEVKRQLSSRLCALIETIPHRVYAEPFVGMGGVFFRRALAAKVETVNDADRDVVTFFRILQRHFPQFMDTLKWQVTSRDEFERLAAQPPELLTDLERAARFLYLQKLSFGGKVRNPTFGIDTCGPSRFDITRLTSTLEAIHERLSGVTIECLGWADFIARWDRPETLFYVDPPYYGTEGYYRASFPRADHEALAALLKGLKGRFILTMNDSRETRAIYGSIGKVQRAELTYTAGGRAKARRAVEIIVVGPTGLR